MTKSQLLKKFASEFDEKYGTKWSSSEELEAAIAHYYRELKVRRGLRILKMMFLASDNRPDFIWTLTSSCSEYLVKWKRDLQDPFLSDQRKKALDFPIKLITTIREFATDLYKDYRLAYPEGTEPPVVSIDEQIQNEDDDEIDLDDDDWLGVDDVAEMLNIKRETVYGKVQSRQIPHHRPGKKIMFKRDDIEEYLLKSRRKSIDEIQAEARKRTKRS